jgi:hypothetical protein
VDRVVEASGSRKDPTKTGGQLKGKTDIIKGSKDLKGKRVVRRYSKRNLHLNQ